MISQSEFRQLVTEAYQRLYDLAYLRRDRLGDLLVHEPDLDRKEKAWRLQRLLLDAIEELDPGAQAPAGSREWRRYRLMLLRYVEVVEPPAIAQQLAISLRQYYREHEAALELLADILWSKLPEPEPLREPPHKQPQSRLEALQLEAIRISSPSPYFDLSEVITATLPLLHKIIDQREITIHIDMPDNLPLIATDRHLFRQLLLGILGHMLEWAGRSTSVRLSAAADQAAVMLSIIFDPPGGAPDDEFEQWLMPLTEIVTLLKAQITLVRHGKMANGLRVALPTNHHTTILIVDDNEDVLALYQRYLTPHGYRVVVAPTAPRGQELARQIRPSVIILDLMMPDQDGWDLLQILLNQPETEHIPIIICSVLNQKDLALSLGVSAFLEKPITEEGLLSVLKTALEKSH